jgi:hypothetical protein
MTTTNGIIEVYDMINYIKQYILKNDIPNYAIFSYFKYDNLLIIILNGLCGRGFIENDIIYLNFYKIFIINNNNDNYEIFIEFNDLTEPKGPI